MIDYSFHLFTTDGIVGDSVTPPFSAAASRSGGMVGNPRWRRLASGLNGGSSHQIQSLVEAGGEIGSFLNGGTNRNGGR